MPSLNTGRPDFPSFDLLLATAHKVAGQDSVQQDSLSNGGTSLPTSALSTGDNNSSIQTNAFLPDPSSLLHIDLIESSEGHSPQVREEQSDQLLPQSGLGERQGKSSRVTLRQRALIIVLSKQRQSPRLIPIWNNAIILERISRPLPTTPSTYYRICITSALEIMTQCPTPPMPTPSSKHCRHVMQRLPILVSPRHL